MNKVKLEIVGFKFNIFRINQRAGTGTFIYSKCVNKR